MGRYVPRVFEFDDFPRGAENALKRLDELKKEFPGFKATVFAVPNHMQEADWQSLLDRRDWIEVGCHGFDHEKKECRKPSHYQPRLALLDLIASGVTNFAPIFKAPWYGYDAGFTAELGHRGIAICCKHAQFFPYPNHELWRVWNRHDRQLCDDPAAAMLVHPDGHDGFDDRTMARIRKHASHGDDWAFVSEMTRPALLKINLGCGEQVWDGWQCLDHRPTKAGITKWVFPESIPFATNSADVIFTSHLMCYLTEEQWITLGLDIWRVLRPGGVWRMADDETAQRAWRKPGQRHATGLIQSLPTPAKIQSTAERIGFDWLPASPTLTISPHIDVFKGNTREYRYDRGHKFYAEAVKTIDIPDFSRVRNHDPRATRSGKYRLPPASAGQ